MADPLAKFKQVTPTTNDPLAKFKVASDPSDPTGTRVRGPARPVPPERELTPQAPGVPGMLGRAAAPFPEAVPPPRATAAERDMAARGIEVMESDVPASVRAKANLAMSPQQKVDYYERTLPAVFGEDVKVALDGNRLIYKRPDKPWAVVDEAGVSLADVGESIPAIAQALTVEAGTIAGGLMAARGIVSPTTFTAAIAGSAAASEFVAELARTYTGRAVGVNTDVSNVDMFVNAARKAGFTGTTTAVASVVVPFIQALPRVWKGVLLSPDEADEIVRRLATEDDIARVEELAGRQIPATVGERTGDERFLELEARLQVGNPELPTIAAARQREMEGIFREVFEGMTPRMSREEAGMMARSAARQTIRAKNDELAQQIDAANRAIDDAVAQIPNTPPGQTMAELRAVIDEVYEQSRAARKQAYDNVDKYIGYNPDAGSIGMKIQIDDELVSRLDFRTMEALGGLSRGSRGQRMGVIPDLEVLRNSDESIALHQINEEIRFLRQGLNEGGFGVGASVDSKLVRNVLDDLVEFRARALTRAGQTDVLDLIEQSEEMARRHGLAFQRSELAKFLMTRGDQQRYNNTELFRVMFKNPSPELVGQVGAIVKRMPGGDSLMARGIFQQWRNDVIDPETGRIKNMRTHMKWLKDNEAIIQEFLGVDDMRLLHYVPTFQQRMERRIKRLEQFQNLLPKTARGRVENLAPERVSRDMLTREGWTQRDVRRYVTALKRNNQTQALEALRGGFGEEIHRIVFPASGKVRVQPLIKLIEDRSDQIRTVMGDQYLGDLKTFARGLERVANPRQPAGRLDKESLFTRALQARLALTGAGVARTAIVSLRFQASQRATYEALTDPAKLRALVASRRFGMEAQQTLGSAAALNASILANPGFGDLPEE